MPVRSRYGDMAQSMHDTAVGSNTASRQEGTPGRRTPAGAGVSMRRWLLLPGAAVVALLVCLTLASAYQAELQRTGEARRHGAAQALAIGHGEAQAHVATMDALALGMMRSAELGRALATRDRSGLLDAAGPAFRQMRAEHGIERMYFIAPDRQVVARLHDPRRSADRSQHGVLSDAVTSGIAAVGIEKLSSGTVVLAVVHPWVSEGRVIGHLMLAVPVSHIADRLQAGAGLQLAVFDLPRAADVPQQRVLLHATGGDVAVILDRLLPPAAPLRLPPEMEGAGLPTDLWSCGQGRCQQAVALPLGRVRPGARGLLVLVQDITELQHSSRKALSMLALAAGTLATLALFALALVAGRVDRYRQEREQAVLAQHRLESEILERARRAGTQGCPRAA